MPFWGLHRHLFLCHEEGTDFILFFSASLFLLYKKNIHSHEEHGDRECFSAYCITVLFFLMFSQRRVLLLLPLCCTYVWLEWSCRANKAALFFTYSLVKNQLFQNSLFHLSHFDNLSLRIIIKKNTIFKQLVFGLCCVRCSSCICG